MALGFPSEERLGTPDEQEWLLLIAYIAGKRTHEQAFKDLFEKIKQDKDHKFHQKANTLASLYDFTPMRWVEE